MKNNNAIIIWGIEDTQIGEELAIQEVDNSPRQHIRHQVAQVNRAFAVHCTETNLELPAASQVHKQ